MAVGYNSLYYSSAVMWNGRSWSAPTQQGKFSVDAVSCPSASFCMGVGPDGVRTWNGKSWSTPTNLNPGSANVLGFTSISCPSTSFCMAVGELFVPTGNRDQPSGGEAAAFTWDGTSWSDVAPLGGAPGSLPRVGDLTSVSCTSTSFCMATSFINGGGAGPTMWNGTSWSDYNLVPGGAAFDFLASPSCVSASFCMANDGLQTAVWNGTSWSSAPAPPNGVLPITCTSASFCLGITDVGCHTSQFCKGASTWDGTSWSSAIPLARYLTVKSMSCASTSFCAVVDDAGFAVTAGAHVATAPWWTNCTDLHKRWPHGVGREHAVDRTGGTPVTNFTRSNYWYGVAVQTNRALDRDGDHIACEAH